MYIQPTTPPVLANLFDREGNSLVKSGDEVAVRLTRHWALTVVADIDVKHHRVRALSYKEYAQYTRRRDRVETEFCQRMLTASQGETLVNSYWYNKWGMVLSPRTWKMLQRPPWQAGYLCLLTDEVKAEMKLCACRRKIDDLLGSINQRSVSAT